MRVALAGPRGPKLGQQPKAVSASVTLPAPVEGWDTETPVKELPQTRATVCDNWIPHGVALEMRKGYSAHLTSLATKVETLMPYNAGATGKLFAAAGANIYDATSAGAVGAASLGSRTSARFSHTNFRTSGGAYLWICNGADAPAHYDGSVWANPSLSLTTFTAADIFWVFESKQRLFVLFKNSLTFGYFATESIAGTIDNFPLGSVFERGGRLVAGATMTYDGGSGPDDYTVFLTSQGEIAVYRGANPGSANEWAKVGTWYIGEPVGDRPIFELDGDLCIITRNGLVPVKQALSGNLATQPLRYLSARISTPFRQRALAQGSSTGWQGLFYPQGDLMIVNAPVTATTAYQYVRHQITQGWSRFTGWNFACFAVFNGRLYAGGIAGNVYLCDDGYDDNGSDIVGDLQTAWTTLGQGGRVKRLTQARPVVTSGTRASVAMVARVDYATSPAVPAPPETTVTGAGVWGSGLWGTAKWGGAANSSRQWRSISGIGHTISLVLRCRSRQSRLALNAIDLIYETGGLM